MCACYSRGTNYPTLEKPGVENIAGCENQGKQRGLTHHWSWIKTLFKKKKKKSDDAKKDEKID